MYVRIYFFLFGAAFSFFVLEQTNCASFGLLCVKTVRIRRELTHRQFSHAIRKEKNTPYGQNSVEKNTPYGHLFLVMQVHIAHFMLAVLPWPTDIWWCVSYFVAHSSTTHVFLSHRRPHWAHFISRRSTHLCKVIVRPALGDVQDISCLTHMQLILAAVLYVSHTEWCVVALHNLSTCIFYRLFRLCTGALVFYASRWAQQHISLAAGQPTYAKQNIFSYKLFLSRRSTFSCILLCNLLFYTKLLGLHWK